MLDEGPQFRLLYDLGCAFVARLELDELIPLVVGKCREVLDAEGAAVLLLDAERSELYFPYVAEEDPEVAGSLADLRLPADQGIAGAVLRSGEPARIDDASVDPRFYADIDASSSLPGEASAVPGCAQPRRREERGPHAARRLGGPEPATRGWQPRRGGAKDGRHRFRRFSGVAPAGLSPASSAGGRALPSRR